jgi:peroxiredoxin
MQTNTIPKRRNSWIFLAGLGCGVCLTAYLGLVALSGLGLLAVDKLTHLMIFGIGSQAPEFSLRDLAFEKVSLAQKLDKPLLLNFGATWCPFCGEETKTLQGLQEYYPDLNVVSVYIMEDAKTVCEYVMENDLSYTFLLDRDAAVAIDYRVWSIPSTFFIDTQGIIQAHYEGLMDGDELNDGLEQIGVTP